MWHLDFVLPTRRKNSRKLPLAAQLKRHPALHLGQAPKPMLVSESRSELYKKVEVKLDSISLCAVCEKPLKHLSCL